MFGRGSARLFGLGFSRQVRKVPKGSTYLTTKYTNSKRARTILKALTMYIGKDIFFYTGRMSQRGARSVKTHPLHQIQDIVTCQKNIKEYRRRQHRTSADLGCVSPREGIEDRRQTAKTSRGMSTTKR